MNLSRQPRLLILKHHQHQQSTTASFKNLLLSFKTSAIYNFDPNRFNRILTVKFLLWDEKINPIVLTCPTAPLEDTANSDFGEPVGYSLKSIHRKVGHRLLLSQCNYVGNWKQRDLNKTCHFRSGHSYKFWLCFRAGIPRQSKKASALPSAINLLTNWSSRQFNL